LKHPFFILTVEEPISIDNGATALSYKSDKEGSFGNNFLLQKSAPIHFNNDKNNEKNLINQDSSPSGNSGFVVSRYRSDFEEIEFLGKGKWQLKFNFKKSYIFYYLIKFIFTL